MSVYIIAEAGVNHNGDMELAKKLIDKAKEAGADAVKFQAFKTELLVQEHTPLAPYQERSQRGSQYEMLKKLEMNETHHRMLLDYAKEKGIDFLTSPFDLDSIDLIDRLGLPIIKIPSGEITNLPYLRKIGNLGKKVILSTGMSYLFEVAGAIDVLEASGTTNITLLHCNTEYPTPMDDVNLLAMRTLRDMFDRTVGFSDHTLGIEASLGAVALGAKVIEKHLTLDRTMEGPDHAASSDPEEFKAMVRGIRNLEKGLGTGLKRPSESELRNKEAARKSMFATRDMEIGEEIKASDIAIKRPGIGLSPMLYDELVGSRAKRTYKKDEAFEL